MITGIVASTLLLFPAAIAAQAVTTAGIRGCVSGGGRETIDARVRVSDDATGFAVEARTAGCQFLIQGLEPGGSYTVVARSLGHELQRRERILLTLGETREIDFVLRPIAARLDTVSVVAQRLSADRIVVGGGTGTTISQSLVEHMPTLNRDFYDFIRLVPQISTKISLASDGLSAGGVGFRFNNFLINGVSERTLSGGVSGAFTGAKSIPLDAVQEYQVLLAPYDVRYGDFAGALVNTVTKSGTNTMHGSAFAFGRSDQLGRSTSSAASGEYQRAQYGLSLGGPIVRDRLHFFVAAEFQRFTYPAAGPYVGQSADAGRPVPVAAADLDRLEQIMKGYGLTAGSAGPVENGNPLRNLFTRLDLALPAWNSRVLVWNNFSGSDDISFSRAASDTFSLSSYQVTHPDRTRATALEFHTALPRAGGGHNELLISNRQDGLDGTGAVQQPVVRVSVPTVSGGRITLNTGTNETAQSSWFHASDFTVSDNLTIPLGASHTASLGVETERFRIRRSAGAGSYGSWSFASLDALEAGVADRYDVKVDLGSAEAPISGMQYALYAGDQWRANNRLSLTSGVRADMLAIDDRAPYQPLVESTFGRRTDEMPRRRIELSPRLGFDWDVSGAGQQYVRGGLGVFTTRYPLGWAQTALLSYGVGGLLRCSRLSPSLQPPPAFTPDYRAAPTTCTGGATITPAFRGDVDLLDKNLRMMRVARGSFVYERRLPWNLVLTNEALVSRSLSDFVVVNLNLSDPASSDAYGRVIYGTIGSTGLATPKTRSPYSEVIDLRNTALNGSYALSTRLEKTSTSGIGGAASYTYSHAHDVETPVRVNTRGTAAWASARVVSGRHDDLSAGISSNDVPQRIVVAGTYAAGRARWRSELSFYYVGESGRPFTYLAYGTLGRGDLNADGSAGNDPIYVPRNALDTVEIRFSGLSDVLGADNSPAAVAGRERTARNAFEDFIDNTPCLRRQRGRILARNTCREPWSNTTIASVRQAVPVAGRALELQLDLSNVLNLLNADWGLFRQAAPALLEHVGQTVESGQTSRPVFRFNSGAGAWTIVPDESAFQLQLGLRYRF